jgi:hypothetical protein
VPTSSSSDSTPRHCQVARSGRNRGKQTVEGVQGETVATREGVGGRTGRPATSPYVKYEPPAHPICPPDSRYPSLTMRPLLPEPTQSILT